MSIAEKLAGLLDELPVLNPPKDGTFFVPNLPGLEWATSTVAYSTTVDGPLSTVNWVGSVNGDTVWVKNPEADFAFVDANGRAHHSTRPAVVLTDGRAMYFWHGVHVPDYVVREPELITPRAIEEQGNQEVRRVMMERYGGIQKYIENCGAKLVETDAFGELYEKDFAPDATWEKLRFVKVKNSTAEPDGTFRDYFLRVPPNAKTPREGIAWTFNMAAKDYAPGVET